MTFEKVYDGLPTNTLSVGENDAYGGKMRELVQKDIDKARELLDKAMRILVPLPDYVGKNTGEAIEDIISRLDDTDCDLLSVASSLEDY